MRTIKILCNYVHLTHIKVVFTNVDVSRVLFVFVFVSLKTGRQDRKKKSLKKRCFLEIVRRNVQKIFEQSFVLLQKSVSSLEDRIRQQFSYTGLFTLYVFTVKKYFLFNEMKIPLLSCLLLL